MQKKELIRIFGSYAKAGKAIGVTRQAIHGWPQVLKTSHIDRVVGTAYRLGISIPMDLLMGIATTK